jgi:hypothetical protein
LPSSATGIVPTKYDKNPALGRWVSTQRSQYKLFHEKKHSTLTQQRIDKLNKLSFVWVVVPPQKSSR